MRVAVTASLLRCKFVRTSGNHVKNLSRTVHLGVCACLCGVKLAPVASGILPGLGVFCTVDVSCLAFVICLSCVSVVSSFVPSCAGFSTPARGWRRSPYPVAERFVRGVLTESDSFLCKLQLVYFIDMLLITA